MPRSKDAGSQLTHKTPWSPSLDQRCSRRSSSFVCCLSIFQFSECNWVQLKISGGSYVAGLAILSQVQQRHRTSPWMRPIQLMLPILLIWSHRGPLSSDHILDDAASGAPTIATHLIREVPYGDDDNLLHDLALLACLTTFFFHDPALLACLPTIQSIYHFWFVHWDTNYCTFLQTVDDDHTF